MLRPARRLVLLAAALSALTACADPGVARPVILAPSKEGGMLVTVTQELDGRLVLAGASRFRPDSCDERIVMKIGKDLPDLAVREVGLQVDGLPEPARTMEESVLVETTLAGSRYLTLSYPSHPAAKTDPNSYGAIDAFGVALLTRRDLTIAEEPDLGLLRLAPGGGVCERILSVWEHGIVQRSGTWELDRSAQREVFESQAARWSFAPTFKDDMYDPRTEEVRIDDLRTYVDDAGRFVRAEVTVSLTVEPLSTEPAAPAAPDVPGGPLATLTERWVIVPSAPPVIVQPPRRTNPDANSTDTIADPGADAGSDR